MIKGQENRDVDQHLEEEKKKEKLKQLGLGNWLYMLKIMLQGRLGGAVG